MSTTPHITLCENGAAIVPAIPTDVWHLLNELAEGRFVEPAARSRMAKYLRSVLPPPDRETQSNNTVASLVRAAGLQGDDNCSWIEPCRALNGE